jgi:NADP-dependent 3-hydroxy acid dehydrogenase YdfG
MRDWTGQRWWIVGASEGLGRALAQEMSKAGAELILSARSADKLADVVASLPGKARAVTIDVSDSASVRAAAVEAGPVDGVVHMAAVYWPMTVQDWDADKVETMCDVNFTGAARVMGAVVPGMVKRGRGQIVLTGSLSGFRGLPGAIGYGASKSGVMHLAETMRADLQGTGVEVQLVNPGFIRTRLTDMNTFRMPFIMEPEEAAKRFFAQMNRRSFAANFPTLFSLVFRGAQFLPDWMYYRLMGR